VCIDGLKGRYPRFLTLVTLSLKDMFDFSSVLDQNFIQKFREIFVCRCTILSTVYRITFHYCFWSLAIALVVLHAYLVVIIIVILINTTILLLSFISHHFPFSGCDYYYVDFCYIYRLLSHFLSLMHLASQV
jgi:hypothetical protein